MKRQDRSTYGVQVHDTGRHASRRGRSAGGPAIQHERLIQVLLQLAEVEAESAISMRRVAAELGVSARLLYQYVSGKAELSALLVDAVSENFSCPPSEGPWKERLLAIAWSSWREIIRYPGLTPHTLLDGIRYRSSRRLRHMVDEIIRAVRDSGLPPHQVSQVHLSLAALIQGHVALFEAQRQTSGDADLTFVGMFDWDDLERSFEASLNGLVASIDDMVERNERECRTPGPEA
jgi:AcrR family transcriptional regulator